MCTVCGKQFHRSDYLKLHSFSHTDERPFYCQICGKGFKMNYNLKIHLKNHEAERVANLQYEERNGLKSVHNQQMQLEQQQQNMLENDQQQDEMLIGNSHLQQQQQHQQLRLQRMAKNQHDNELISLLAQADDEEIEGLEVDEDIDEDLIDGDIDDDDDDEDGLAINETNHHNFKLSKPIDRINGNKYNNNKVATYVINNTDTNFNFISYQNHHNSTSDTRLNNKEQINNLINSASDSLNF